MNFRRELKFKLANRFLDYDLTNGSVTLPPSCIMFENGLRSSYDATVKNLAQEEFDIVKLGLNFSVRNFFARPALDLNNPYIFFHSPGESLQRFICSQYRSKNLPKTWCGFQHGLIGKSPPAALKHVLSRSVVPRYISIESTFSDMLYRNSGAEVLEFLQPLGDYEPVHPVSGSCFDIYFDSSDMDDFSNNISQCKLFLASYNCAVSNLYFHPATSDRLRKKVTRVFSSWFTDANQINGAIFWKSKLKYDMADKGVPIFSLHHCAEHNTVLLERLVPNTYSNTTSHLRSALIEARSQFI